MSATPFANDMQQLYKKRKIRKLFFYTHILLYTTFLITFFIFKDFHMFLFLSLSIEGVIFVLVWKKN